MWGWCLLGVYPTFDFSFGWSLGWSFDCSFDWSFGWPFGWSPDLCLVNLIDSGCAPIDMISCGSYPIRSALLRVVPRLICFVRAVSLSLRLDYVWCRCCCVIFVGHWCADCVLTVVCSTRLLFVLYCWQWVGGKRKLDHLRSATCPNAQALLPGDIFSRHDFLF